MKIRWRFGVLAGCILAIFSLYPQARLISERGREWNGHIAYNDVDETAYAAYLNALIDGRARKNDPYTGLDDDGTNKKPESIFSIQPAAPYVIAIPARLFGISANTSMIIAGAVAAFAAGLAIFWLIMTLGGDAFFSFAASLAVIGFGTLAAGEGAIREILYGEVSYPFLPGFRRYVPAVAFPVFFAFCTFVWRAAAQTPLQKGGKRTGLRWISYATPFAAVCFGFMLFSYFYLWTAALAFLAAVILTTLACRPAKWGETTFRLATLACFCLILLVPYGLLIARRADSTDAYQLLTHSHSLDLFRGPEVTAILAALILVFGLAIRRVEFRDQRTMFTASLILSIFGMFNQQVVTGLSLQPIHFQVFVANYVAILALLLAAWLTASSMGERFPRAASIALAVSAVIWCGIESEMNSRVLDEANIRLDAAAQIVTSLRRAAEAEPLMSKATVLAYDLTLADDLPSEATQNVLWARHQAVFGSLSRAESERRFFCYLYYLNVDGDKLRRLLKSDFITITALFGWDRYGDRLSTDATPLTDTEIETEVAKYEQFRHSFSISDAADPQISFVIVPEGYDIDLSALRQWYDLEEMSSAGANTLYRVHLIKPNRTRPQRN